jgi:uncharacterized protein (TIGR02246 family)
MSADRATRALYRKLLQAWNDRDAAAMCALLTPDGSMVGFDGSSFKGPDTVLLHLKPILDTLPTPTYVASVREVRELGPDITMLLAAAGMVPRGKGNINPALNALQCLVAQRSNSEWRIAHFQTTPAAFHDRPEQSDALSLELRAALQKGGLNAIGGE